MFKNDAGPNLKADFYISKGIITKIHLTSSQNQGLCWEIVSEENSSYLSNRIEQWMQEYASGKQPTVLLPICIEHLPPFTQKVLHQLMTFKFGQTSSYGQLAEKIQHPKAARAVGNACGNNPLPLIIPCHRILASLGRLGGFSAGLDIKEKLLRHEGIIF